jgi:hypothetical protein
VRSYPDVVVKSFDMGQAVSSKGQMAEVARLHQAKEEKHAQSSSKSASKRGWSAMRTAARQLQNDVV